jgi:ParB-like chromosome segregation protein Spo0J
MPKIEFRLLKISILADGWTQPIVVSGKTIVDGEHRWTVAGDPEVAALTGGMVPIVRVSADLADQMMSTVRHNRARGNHLVLPMGEIVRSLLEAGRPKEQVMELMQMEEEEVDRLAERAGMPAQVARSSSDFNKGWQPG